MRNSASSNKLSIQKARIRLKVEKERRKRGLPAKESFVRLALYPKQSAIVDDPSRFTICEATTKAGKTMSHLEWLLDEAIKAKQGHWWWVAPVSETADIAFRRACDRLKGFIDSCGKLQKVRESIRYRKNETRKFIKVKGATIWFKSADTPDSLFGEDVRGAVGDEITRWKEASWTAVYTTLTATKGRVKLIGNVKGRHNFAYKLARKAQAGETDWGYHKLTALDAISGGVIDGNIVDQAKRDLSEEAFLELYFAEASEDGTNPFNLKAIQDCVIEKKSDKPAIVYGLDIARKRDWLVLIGLDEDGSVCVHERWTKFALWAEKEQKIIDIVGSTPILADSTGIGDRVVEALRTGYKDDEGKIHNCPCLEDYPFTETSRQQLLEGLEVAIQKHLIGFPDGIIKAQLDSFEIEHTRQGVKYAAPDGMHDDDVIALALAREKYRRNAALIRLNLGNTNSFNGQFVQPTFNKFNN